MGSGTTACSWDTIIPFEPLWEQLERVIKDNGAMVFTGSQPFTSALVMSNPKHFKYAWVWNKVKSSTALNAKHSPLRVTEDVLIFSKSKTIYNPVMVLARHRVDTKNDKNGEAFGDAKVFRKHDNRGLAYPKNLLTISNADQTNRYHPTQKPVALLEYLIKTYTNEGDTVLDPTAGSFTTAIACENLKRNWVCIEKEEKYCEIGRKRIEENRLKLSQNL